MRWIEGVICFFTAFHLALPPCRDQLPVQKLTGEKMQDHMEVRPWRPRIFFILQEKRNIEGRKYACALKLRSHTGHVSFRSFSLDVYYIDSSRREPRFVLVPLRFASEAWPRAGLGSRAGLGEPRSASNANKPASSWPSKQGRKKCSKHGCDRGTSTVGKQNV